LQDIMLKTLSHMDGRTHGQARNRKPSAANHWWRHK